MRLPAASVARCGIAALLLVSAVSCGGSTPSSPSPTTTTTTVLTSSTLTVALAPNCAGVIQAGGLDVFLDGVLVGVATQNQPFVRTVPVGTHTIRGRDSGGFSPETTIDITAAQFVFAIGCG